MYILTFTKQGSDYVDMLIRTAKEDLIKDTLNYFNGFVKSTYDFNQDNLLTLLKFVIKPQGKSLDVPRIVLGEFHFSLVQTD